jgi:hypothetical protein
MLVRCKWLWISLCVCGTRDSLWNQRPVCGIIVNGSIRRVTELAQYNSLYIYTHKSKVDRCFRVEKRSWPETGKSAREVAWHLTCCTTRASRWLDNQIDHSSIPLFLFFFFLLFVVVLPSSLLKYIQWIFTMDLLFKYASFVWETSINSFWARKKKDKFGAAITPSIHFRLIRMEYSEETIHTKESRFFFLSFSWIRCYGDPNELAYANSPSV